MAAESFGDLLSTIVLIIQDLYSAMESEDTEALRPQPICLSLAYVTLRKTTLTLRKIRLARNR